jgi:hypothetical protein
VPVAADPADQGVLGEQVGEGHDGRGGGVVV